MAKTKISEFNANPALNTDIDSINLAEGCAPSGINDAIRELMAQLKDWQSGTSNDPYVVGSSGSLTLNQGTANGVAYLNGSKVVTSGSALTFDGTNLTLGGSQRINGTTTSGLTIASSSGAGNGFKLYNDSTNDLAYLMNFYNGSMIFGVSNAEGMRLTSTGLGIGTSSPTTKLDVFTTEETQARFVRDLATDAGTAIASDNEGAILSTIGVHNLRFFTNNTERARIDSSGNLLVGTTSTSGSSGGTYGSVFTQGTNFANLRLFGSGTQTFAQFLLSGTSVGTIVSSGATTNYNTSSDYRLKNTIAPMTGALAKVAALKPVTYKWNVDGSDGEGFIAHELAEVCPQAVTGAKDATCIEQYEISPAVPATYDEDGNELTAAVEAVMGEREVPQYQGIDVSFLVATLTAAIQELKAEFDAYKASHP